MAAVGVHHPGPEAQREALRGRLRRRRPRLLFALGAVLAYISLSRPAWSCCSAWPATTSSSRSPRRTTSASCSRLLVAFGVSFELPLIAVALNLVGVLSLRGAGQQPPVDLLPHHRLRRVRHAHPGPVHHAADGRADDRAVRAGHPDRPVRRPAAGQAGRPPRASTTWTTTRPRRWTHAVAARRRAVGRTTRAPRLTRRWTSPLLVSPAAGPRPGPGGRRRRRSTRCRAGWRCSRAVLPATTGPTPRPRPPRRSPRAPARWSRSAATAPCTPPLQAVAGTADAAGRRPGRHRQRPGRWPWASRADPVAAARAAAEDLPPGAARTVDAGRTGGPVVGHGAVLRLRLRGHRPGQPAALAPRAAGATTWRSLAELARLRPARARGSSWTASRARCTVTLVAVGNTAWYGGGHADLPGRRPGRRAARRHRRRAAQPPGAGPAPGRG